MNLKRHRRTPSRSHVILHINVSVEIIIVCIELIVRASNNLNSIIGKSKEQGPPPRPGIQIFISMQFCGKLAKIIGWRHRICDWHHHLWESWIRHRVYLKIKKLCSVDAVLLFTHTYPKMSLRLVTSIHMWTT